MKLYIVHFIKVTTYFFFLHECVYFFYTSNIFNSCFSVSHNLIKLKSYDFAIEQGYSYKISKKL